MNAIAIIPARGGSKRIPRKNVRVFAGKPMIAHAISVALESGLFSKVIVSTDDAEIAAISVAAGAETPFQRPADLADDITPTVPVIAHAVREMLDRGEHFDHACCIYPGVPFLLPQDLLEGRRLLDSAAAPYAFPVVPFPSPIQRALRRADDGRVEPFDPQYVLVRTQDLEPAYHDAGQFYWGGNQAWLDGLAIHANGAAFVMPEWRIVDIDTEADWIRAELIHSALRSPGAPTTP